MRILFLSQRVPYPPNRGDKITTWKLIERMRRRHEVVVVALSHDEADAQGARDLEAMGIETHAFPINTKVKKLTSLPLLLTSKPMTLGVFGSTELQACVDRLAPSCDLAYAYSSSMAAFLEPHHHFPRVMHFAELDSDKWRQYAERSRWPASWVYGHEHRTLLEYERRIAHAFADNVLCTPLEQDVFESAIPGPHSMVLRNGVDLEYYQPRPELAEERHLVFTGVMDYLPNIDGCTHFVQDVLPLVRAKYPDTRFTIVGSKPTSEVQALGEVEGIEVTGFVDDTRDWIGRACLSVAPLRIARGIQNKVLEALAMGLPVVGTTSATQGVEGRPGRDYLLANTAREQADAICGLFADPAELSAQGTRGREFVERSYDWDKVLEPLDALLERLVPGSR